MRPIIRTVGPWKSSIDWRCSFHLTGVYLWPTSLIYGLYYVSISLNLHGILVYPLEHRHSSLVNSVFTQLCMLCSTPYVLLVAGTTTARPNACPEREYRVYRSDL
ncbi:hypothetical protein F4679DRAFT_103621 [Xylaria curta]|nr:hypothetical protein F4679DRAFT_103621 [Xylaria curta]